MPRRFHYHSLQPTLVLMIPYNKEPLAARKVLRIVNYGEAMRKGILVDFVWSCVNNMGTVAIEAMETHSLEKLTYEKGLAVDRYKGKLVYWECDESGTLVRVKPVKDS